MTLYVGLAVLAIAIAVLIFSSVYAIEQQTNGIVERFGRFKAIWEPGLHFCLPFIDQVVSRISLRVRQLDVQVETKTQDNVFVSLKISVQYQVGSDKTYDAYYSLEDHSAQITSYIFDTVRAEVPKMKLDDVFVKKNEVADSIQNELKDSMLSYGYEIKQALVTDIDPAGEVKQAMNRINAAERLQEAAKAEGEAVRIKMVAEAAAESESKKLQGKGIADQRTAIATGLKESIETLKGVGVKEEEATSLLMITQHYDALQSIGANNKSSLLLLPATPQGSFESLSQFLAAGMSQKNQ